MQIRKIKTKSAEKLNFVGLEGKIIVRNTQSLAKKMENKIVTKGECLFSLVMVEELTLF